MVTVKSPGAWMDEKDAFAVCRVVASFFAGFFPAIIFKNASSRGFPGDLVLRSSRLSRPAG